MSPLSLRPVSMCEDETAWRAGYVVEDRVRPRPYMMTRGNESVRKS